MTEHSNKDLGGVTAPLWTSDEIAAACRGMRRTGVKAVRVSVE